MAEKPTNDSPLAGFIALLNSNEDLRQRVERAEEKLADAIKRETDSITEIAAGAGYDIGGWNSTPQTTGPTDDELATHGFCCSLTCCVVSTSTTG
jgi:hypothetical protein